MQVILDILDILQILQCHYTGVRHGAGLFPAPPPFRHSHGSDPEGASVSAAVFEAAGDASAPARLAAADGGPPEEPRRGGAAEGQGEGERQSR